MKLLLLTQRLFHLAPFGHIHQRALVADDLAGAVPHRAGCIEEDAGRTIPATQCELPAALAPPVVDASPQTGPWLSSRLSALGSSDRSSSRLLQPSILTSAGLASSSLPSGSEVHAFLQGFEEFSKAALFLAFFGDVTRESADPHNLVALDDGIQYAVEIKRARAVLDLDRNQP